MSAIAVMAQDGRNGAGEIRKIEGLELAVFDLMDTLKRSKSNPSSQEKTLGAIRALLAQRAFLQEGLIWGNCPL